MHPAPGIIDALVQRIVEAVRPSQQKDNIGLISHRVLQEGREIYAA